MSTIIGQYAEGLYQGNYGVSANQVGGGPWTVPADGSITRLGAWLCGGCFGFTIRLCIWDVSTGALLGKTGTFSFSTSTPTRYEYDLDTPATVTANQTIMIGYWFVTDGSHYANGRLDAASGNWYKAQGNSAPGSMSGHATDGNYRLTAYAYLTPSGGGGSAPNSPIVENYGFVGSLTPTIRAYLTTPDGSHITSYQFNVTGTSPAHAKVVLSGVNGDWASGTWVSYTLNPSDLGWTPASGNTLTYECWAANSHGSAGSGQSSPFTIFVLGADVSAAPTVTFNWGVMPTGADHITLMLTLDEAPSDPALAWIARLCRTFGERAVREALAVVGARGHGWLLLRTESRLRGRSERAAAARRAEMLPSKAVIA
jgi:hypothetical protein